MTAGAGALPVGPRDDIPIGEEGLGFDSLARLGLVARLNRVFGLAATGIEDYLLLEPTFGGWVRLIDTHFRKCGEASTLTFSTSGTTRAPRHITRKLSDLVAEARAHGAHFFPDDAAAGRVLSAVPPFHIYGFMFSVLVPGLTGREVVDLAASGPGAAARPARRGDLVVGTPTTWHAAFASDVVFEDGVTGVTSGAAAAEEIWSGAAGARLCRLDEIYGATESGGIGLRSRPDRPFQLLAHLVRKGDGVHPGQGSSAALPVQDHLDWTSATTFRLAGRIDGAVQVGGVNVWPDAVATWLGEQPGVAAASVRVAEGRLKAFVVPSEPEDRTGALAAQLLGAMNAGLTAPERPVSLTFGRELPLSAMGKPCDWA